MEINELIDLLRDRLSINIVTETECECSGEYATISVSLDFIDDGGNRHTISRDNDSILINRD